MFLWWEQLWVSASAKLMKRWNELILEEDEDLFSLKELQIP